MYVADIGCLDLDDVDAQKTGLGNEEAAFSDHAYSPDSHYDDVDVVLHEELAAEARAIGNVGLTAYYQKWVDEAGVAASQEEYDELYAQHMRDWAAHQREQREEREKAQRDNDTPGQDQPQDLESSAPAPQQESAEGI